MLIIPLLPLLPGSLCLEMVVLVRVPSMNLIDLFKDYLFSKGILDSISLNYLY